MDRKQSILKALSHPARLKIAEGLRNGERSACEIGDDFSMDRTTISKHFSVLKNAGVVTTRKEGVNVFYSLKLFCFGKLMACIEGNIRQELLEGLETFEKGSRSR